MNLAQYIVAMSINISIIVVIALGVFAYFSYLKKYKIPFNFLKVFAKTSEIPFEESISGKTLETFHMSPRVRSPSLCIEAYGQ